MCRMMATSVMLERESEWPFIGGPSRSRAREQECDEILNAPRFDAGKCDEENRCDAHSQP
jgi:hypothetical protein